MFKLPALRSLIRVSPLPTFEKEDEDFILGDFYKEEDVRKFEEKFLNHVNARYAVSFGKGRIGLYSILKALGVGRRDEVIVPAYTCFVVPNAIHYLGARPVYVDVDPRSYNMDMDEIEEKVTSRTKVIIPHHLFGQAMDVKPLSELREERGIYIVEDCAQALGAEYKGKRTPLGGTGFFSFDFSKNITTGQGGIVVTNSSELYEKLNEIRKNYSLPPKRYIHSILIELLLRAHLAKFPVFLPDRILSVIFRNNLTREEYRCEVPKGYPFRLPGILARIGTFQLKKFKELTERRIKIAERYNELLFELGGSPPFIHPGAKHVFLRYVIRVRDRGEFQRFLRKFRIVLESCWYDYVVHPQKEMRLKLGYQEGSCPSAEKAARNVVNIPCHPKLSEEEIERVASSLRECFSEKKDLVLR